MKLRRSRLLWVGAAVLALGAGYFVLRGRSVQAAFTTAPVDRGDVVEVVGATGTLEAVTTVQLGSQVSGTIESLHADFNSTVSKGQVVARLDPSLFDARLGQAHANLLAARANVDRARATVEDTRQKFERAKELAARKLLPETELETAKANYDGAVAQQKASEAAQSQAQANLNQAEVDKSHTVIRTPIDGVVISRNVDVGQTVAASFQAPVLFLIANDLTRMRVNASIDEADVGRVREGQEVRFHVDAYPEREFAGRVEQVRLNPTTVQNVVTYNTIVAVDNHDLLLRPGMTATVSVVVRKAPNALRIPTAALRFRPEGYERPAGRPGAGGVGAAGARRAGGERPAAGDGAIPGAAMAGERRGSRSSGGEGSRSPGRPGAGGAGGPGGAGAPGAASSPTAPGSGANAPGAAADAGAGRPGGAGQGWSGGRGPGRPTTVFVPDAKGEPKPIEVRIGISDGQFVELREGLEEGTAVITGAQIPGARAGSGPRPGSSPSSNPFQPQRPQPRQR